MQATLAARAVMKRALTAGFRAHDDDLSATTREVLLATQHARLGVCAPGTCPADPQAQGHMEAVLPEGEAYVQLQNVARQLDVKRAAARAGCGTGGIVQANAALAPALAAVQLLQHSAAYHWVNVATKLFGKMSATK